MCGILTRNIESTLSRMTDVTIPSLETQGNDSVTETACAHTNSLQTTDEPLYIAKTIKTTDGHDKNTNFVPPQTRVEEEIIYSPKTPQSTTSPSPPNPRASPGCSKSVSDFIDDWHSALHPALLPSSYNRTICRGSVLVPPHRRRQQHHMANLPTQRHAKTEEAIRLPKPSPIRSIADNLDAWKTPADWARISSADTRITAPRGTGGGDTQDEDGALSLLSADLNSAIRFWERDAGSTKGLLQDDTSLSVFDQLSGRNSLPA